MPEGEISMEKRDEITDFEEALTRVDYRDWFTDTIVNNYLPSFEKRYKTVNEEDKEDVFEEAKVCILNYSLLVYYIYPNSEEFRKAVDGNPELKRNFRTISTWLEGMDARKYADDFVADLIASQTVSER
jgi:hypothetical protein